jgi:hypothetical protein
MHIRIRKIAAEGLEQCSLGGHTGQIAQLAGIQLCTQCRFKQNIDRPIFAQDCPIQGDRPEGREQLLKELLIELVENFQGHGIFVDCCPRTDVKSLGMGPVRAERLNPFLPSGWTTHNHLKLGIAASMATVT